MADFNDFLLWQVSKSQCSTKLLNCKNYNDRVFAVPFQRPDSRNPLHVYYLPQHLSQQQAQSSPLLSRWGHNWFSWKNMWQKDVMACFYAPFIHTPTACLVPLFSLKHYAWTLNICCIMQPPICYILACISLLCRLTMPIFNDVLDSKKENE